MACASSVNDGARASSGRAVDPIVMVYSQYNERNVEITLNDVQSILTRYGVPGTVRNLNLYRRAFVHKSYLRRPRSHNDCASVAPRPVNCPPLRTKSNERLEFIGDGVLECITKYYLYKRFPKEDEGFMTEKKIALVKNEHIGKLAMEMQLHKWLIISHNAEEKNTRYNLKKIGCLFEAFLGALFLDFNGQVVDDQDRYFRDIYLTGPGFQTAQVFLERVFDKHVDWSNIIHVKDNYKNILQVHIQKMFKVTPMYVTLNKCSTEYDMGVVLLVNDNAHTVTESHSLYERAVPFDQYGSWDIVRSQLTQSGKLCVALGRAKHRIKKHAEQLACKATIDSCPFSL